MEIGGQSGGERFSLEMVEASQIGESRRLATKLAASLGFDEQEQANVSIVASELATNLVRHAKQGELMIQTRPAWLGGGLEMLAVDCGPGIADLSLARSDGYSTRGTAGNGLGAIQRLSSTFDIHTSAAGTVLLSRFNPPAAKSVNPVFEVGAVCVPVRGEIECGDAWSARELDGKLQVIAVDGLGHGALAASAAKVAIESFTDYANLSPIEIMRRAHEAMRATRGAAIAIAEIDPANARVNYCGVGNISGVVVEGLTSKSMVSVNGTVGAQVHRIQDFSYPWSSRSTLLMFSDGLNSHLRVDRLPGLMRQDASVIAGVLYREFKRGRDDASIIVARQGDTA